MRDFIVLGFGAIVFGIILGCIGSIIYNLIEMGKGNDR